MRHPSAKSLKKFLRKQASRQYRFVNGKRLHARTFAGIEPSWLVAHSIKKFVNNELTDKHEAETDFCAACIPTEICYNRGKYEWRGYAISLPNYLSKKTFVRYRARKMREIWGNRPHPLDTPLERTYKGALRAYIIHNRGKKCEWCGDKNGLEIDHILPWRDGGLTTVKNAQVLCKSCNTGKYHLERKGYEVA